MDPISSTLASRITLTPPVAQEDPQPQDVDATIAAPALSPAGQTLSTAQSALAVLVPEGGLHPASPKPGVAMGGAGIIGFVAMEALAKWQRDRAEEEQEQRNYVARHRCTTNPNAC